MLTVCLAEEECKARQLASFSPLTSNGLVCGLATHCAQGDAAPYRLMFWEDISAEFLECIAQGITPIFLGTASIYEYVDARQLPSRLPVVW